MYRLVTSTKEKIFYWYIRDQGIRYGFYLLHFILSLTIQNKTKNWSYTKFYSTTTNIVYLIYEDKIIRFYSSLQECRTCVTSRLRYSDWTNTELLVTSNKQTVFHLRFSFQLFLLYQESYKKRSFTDNSYFSFIWRNFYNSTSWRYKTLIMKLSIKYLFFSYTIF